MKTIIALLALCSALTVSNAGTLKLGARLNGIPIQQTENPLTITCPADAIVECNGQPVNLTSTVTDTDGNALQVVWTLNGTDVQTNLVAQGAATNGVDVVLAANLMLGTNILQVTASDTASNQVSCDSIIILQDTNAPVITGATVTPACLWPPNHKLVPVTINVTAEDDCCLATWKIISVTSNEPVGSGNDENGDGNDKKKDGGKGNKKGKGKGNDSGKGSGSCTPPPDWVITGDQELSLRAERKGKCSGRIYTITVQAVDCAGNLSEPVELTVTVPHDKRHDHDDDQDKDQDHCKGQVKGQAKSQGHK